MGKMFGNLTGDALEQAEDRLGGNEPLASGVYDATIKVAYAGQSPRGAQSITVVADVNGRELRETIYITNTKGENFYADKQDSSKKHPLPGFTTIDDLCLLTTGDSLAEQDVEEKVVKVYNFQERKEENQTVPVLIGLIGKQVKLGILREIVDKEKKDDAGNYRPTGETRTLNTIDKVFHYETKRTVNEYRHEIESPEFFNAWSERNTGKDRDKSSKNRGDAGQSGTGRPGAAGGAAGQSAKKKLFG